jgi:hypothetical protein
MTKASLPAFELMFMYEYFADNISTIFTALYHNMFNNKCLPAVSLNHDGYSFKAYSSSITKRSS